MKIIVHIGIVRKTMHIFELFLQISSCLGKNTPYQTLLDFLRLAM